MPRRKAPKPTGPDTGLIYAISHPWQWLLAASWRGVCRHWRGLTVLLAALVVSIWWGSWIWGLLLIAAVLAARAFIGSKRTGPGWWSTPQLPKALVDAGILRKNGDMLPSLSYRGKPQHSEHGTSVTVGLPQAKTLADVVGRRDALASAMRIPTRRLEIGQDADDPANVVRILVTDGAPKDVTAAVATAERTSWADPVRIGRDSHGKPVAAATFEANTLIAGRMGSGKTVTTRIPLAHFLLDPVTQVFLLDGKGSVDDYGACRPLCARFVTGVDEDAVPDTLTMLTEVLTLVRARNAVTRPAGGWPGVLLLLEEFQDVRSAATRPQRDELDETLGRVIRMGRAVGVHVLISTQRPTVEDLPSGTRNLISQGIVLMVRDPADARLVLGRTPTMALPSKRGQALYGDQAEVRAVTLDRLTDAQWKAVCKRATKLRGASSGIVRRALEREVTPPIAAPPATGEDPLLSEVLSVLADADPRGLAASELYSRLPEWTRPVCPSAHALGMGLSRYPLLVERVYAGNGRVWRLTSAGRSDLSAGAY